MQRKWKNYKVKFNIAGTWQMRRFHGYLFPFFPQAAAAKKPLKISNGWKMNLTIGYGFWFVSPAMLVAWLFKVTHHVVTTSHLFRI